MSDVCVIRSSMTCSFSCVTEVFLFCFVSEHSGGSRI